MPAIIEPSIPGKPAIKKLNAKLFDRINKVGAVNVASDCWGFFLNRCEPKREIVDANQKQQPVKNARSITFMACMKWISQ